MYCWGIVNQFKHFLDDQAHSGRDLKKKKYECINICFKVQAEFLDLTDV